MPRAFVLWKLVQGKWVWYLPRLGVPPPVTENTIVGHGTYKERSNTDPSIFDTTFLHQTLTTSSPSH